jgi:hypothetical protein
MPIKILSLMKLKLFKFDKIIDELEPEYCVSVLIKKYIKQNARVVAFNVDHLTMP